MSDHSPSSVWLRLFSRIRCFLFLKSSIATSRTQSDHSRSVDMITMGKTDTKIKEEDGLTTTTLHRSVKNLHFGNWEEKESAAKELKILARDDPKMRRSMVQLGVIPPLVAMLGSEVLSRRQLALQVLLQLANGIYTNKALMVEAGILSKIPETVKELDITIITEFAELLLSISSLAHCQFPNLTASRTIPFLVSTLESNSTSLETKELCLATLYNLSTLLKNARDLVNEGVANILVQFSFVKETSEKSLAILGNLVAGTVIGNKSMENHPMVPESLIEILTWEDEPKCQELAVYILMILAHQSPIHRLKMVKAGIVPVLLGVALLGSPLAQKRASKMLQWFKDERQARMGAHSGPQMGGSSSMIGIGSPMNQREASEGKKMMRMLVKQSLYKNMETIVRRAGEGEGGIKSSKAMTVYYSSSKSFPY